MVLAVYLKNSSNIPLSCKGSGLFTISISDRVTFLLVAVICSLCLLATWSLERIYEHLVQSTILSKELGTLYRHFFCAP